LPESFIKPLFQGELSDQAVHPFPDVPRAEENALHPILEGIRRLFSEEVDSAELDLGGRIPKELERKLSALGLFGLSIPTEHGGSGLSATAYARVMQEVAGYDASIARMLAAHQALGAASILAFGTPAQKSHYLPRLARGELVAAFALAEEAAGSDAAGIQTRAEPASGGGFTLDGAKTWVTNGAGAGLFVVFARTSPREDGAKPRITAFLVDKGEGVSVRGGRRKLGLSATSTPTVDFRGVPLGPEAVLGEVGRGFLVAMEVQGRGRLGLAAGCVGVCQRLIKLVAARCTSRRAFHRPIGEFGLVKDRVASMMADTFALESMTYLTTGMVDRGATDFAVETAVCKIFASEALLRVADHASCIAGSNGYLWGEPYERILRDARANLLLEGTNETLRCFVALSGMQGPGKELVEVGKAMREPIKGFGLLSDFALRKARTALGRERITWAAPQLMFATAVFEDHLVALSKHVERALRKHGKDIAEMQFTQKRVADVAIDLYAIVAVISRTTRAVERHGEEGSRREMDLAHVFVDAAEKRLRALALSFDENDDDLRKAVATKAYNDGGYPFDIF
jgi:acyl-CoA dehydrogenase family protein 9